MTYKNLKIFFATEDTEKHRVKNQKFFSGGAVVSVFILHFDL